MNEKLIRIALRLLSLGAIAALGSSQKMPLRHDRGPHSITRSSRTVSPIGKTLTMLEPAIVESIKKMSVDGQRINLPVQPLKNYTAVKKTLLKAGGAYKKDGFVFQNDAQSIFDALIGGKKIDNKQKFQEFYSPKNLVDRMIGIADIDTAHRVAEPSAGHGAIADQILSAGVSPYCFEIRPESCNALKAKHTNVFCRDWLSTKESEFGLFDRILANPPFTKNQDIDHVLHMYRMLAPKGQLISVMSCSWVHGRQKKQKSFKDWLYSAPSLIQNIPAGTFKDSGTSVAAKLVIIYKN